MRCGKIFFTFLLYFVVFAVYSCTFRKQVTRWLPFCFHPNEVCWIFIHSWYQNAKGTFWPFFRNTVNYQPFLPEDCDPSRSATSSKNCQPRSSREPRCWQLHTDDALNIQVSNFLCSLQIHPERVGQRSGSDWGRNWGDDCWHWRGRKRRSQLWRCVWIFTNWKKEVKDKELT